MMQCWQSMSDLTSKGKRLDSGLFFLCLVASVAVLVNLPNTSAATPVCASSTALRIPANFPAEQCAGSLNGSAVALSPPYNGSTQYSRINFSGSVQCSTAAGCPSAEYINRYNTANATGVSSAAALPFLFPSVEVSQPNGAINTLYFPNSRANVLDRRGLTAPGVYTFNFWAQTLCGKVSKPVTLVGRCPPAPTACGVVRLASDNSILPFSNGAYVTTTGKVVTLDSQPSHAFQFKLPGQSRSSFYLTSVQWAAASSGNPPGGLVWIKKGTQASSTPTHCSGDLSSQATCSCNNGQSALCTNRYAMLDVPGVYTFQVQVSDGCSSANAPVKINVQCSCTPTIAVAATPSPNTQTTGTVKGALNNRVSPQAALYTLQASAVDYDSGTRFRYDWGFDQWTPLWSQAIAGSTYGQAIGLKNVQFGTCVNENGQQSAGQCFSSPNVVTSVSQVQRPALSSNSQNNFKYAVLYTVTPPGTQKVSNWEKPKQGATPTRVQTWRFMRIGPECPAAATTPFQAVGQPVKSVEFNQSQSLLYVPNNAKLMPQMWKTNIGFSNNGRLEVPVTSVGSSTGPAYGTKWSSTRFRAMLSRKQYSQNTTITYQSTTRQQLCTVQYDLSLCEVSISQSPGSGNFPYTQNKAALSFSSFTACRGLWTMQGSVSDGCSTAVDKFSLRVGCNRSPRAVAGCENTQSWTVNGFAQVNLDGRASYDADNFGDNFYNLTVPSSIGNASLTYTWSLISGPRYNASNPVATCPFVPNAKCAQAYCTGPARIAYATSNLATGTQTITPLMNNQASNYGPSPQGNTTLFQAYNGWPAAYSQNITNNPQVVSLGSLQSSAQDPVQSQQIFGSFVRQCAPTVLPQFYEANGHTPANKGTTNYVLLNSQHKGQSAFMSGIKLEGTFKVRLYAFDGCSVSSSDVTVAATCPSVSLLNTGTASTVNVIMFSQPGLKANEAYRFAIPNVTVVYAGLANTPVYVDVFVTYAGVRTKVCSNVGNVKGPGSNRPIDLSSCRVAAQIGKAGVYTIEILPSDGCNRQSGGTYTIYGQGRTLSYNAQCPVTVSAQAVLQSPQIQTWSLNRAGWSNYAPPTNGAGATLPSQSIKLTATVANASITGNTQNRANEPVDFTVSLMYVATADFSNINNIQFPALSTVFQNTTAGNTNKEVTQFLHGGYKHLSFSSNRMPSAVNNGQGAGYGNFTNACSSGVCAVSNNGAYLAQIVAVPRNFKCASSSPTVRFAVGCASLPSVTINLSNSTANVGAGPAGPVPTLAPFISQKVSGSSVGQGSYAAGTGAFSGRDFISGPGAFKKIPITARAWSNFQCSRAGCAGSNTAGSNVLYNLQYSNVVSSGNNNQNPLGLSPYAAYQLAAGVAVNPFGFTHDPQVVSFSMPGRWTIISKGQDSCSFSKGLQTFTAGNVQSNVAAYCDSATMPVVNMGGSFDFSTRTRTTPVVQPAFTYCGSQNGASRRLLRGYSAVPNSGAQSNTAFNAPSCSNLCGNSLAKGFLSTTIFWDSFDVAPEFKGTSLHQRNFNDMGTISTLAGNIVQGNGVNYRGRFADFVLQVNTTSYACSGNSCNNGTRYVSWFDFGTNGPRAGTQWPPSNSGFTSCSSLASNGFKAQGCSPLFQNGNAYSSLPVTGFMGKPSALGSGAANLGALSNKVTSRSHFGNSAGTFGLQVMFWNGPPGLSCYDYRSVQICALCNPLSLSQIQVAGSSQWDGAKFPTVGLTSTVTYKQYSMSTSGSRVELNGNLYSLSYAWQVTSSPWASRLGMMFGASHSFTTGYQNTTIKQSGQAVTVPKANGELFNSRLTTFQYNHTYTAVTASYKTFLLNHDDSGPRTCIQPDVEGTYKVSLTASDGCSTTSPQVANVQATCPALPSDSNVNFVVQPATSSSASTFGAGSSVSVTVSGQVFDRVAVRINLPATANSVYQYSWSATFDNAEHPTQITNGVGSVISFVPPQFTRSTPVNNRAVKVKVVVTNSCPTASGQKTNKIYTLNVNLVCNTGLQSNDLTIPEVRVIETASPNLDKLWWGNNATLLQQYSNRTSMPLACSLVSNGGKPSRYCGAIAGGSAPTLLYESSTYGFYNRHFEVDGSYSPKCPVQSTFWEMKSMACSLPYYPSFTVSPPPVKKCMPKVNAYWTVAETPCKRCPYTAQDICVFNNYLDGPPYLPPVSTGWACIYAQNGRKSSQGNATLISNCGVSGVGMESSLLDPVFTARFPGKYTLNYTIVDGCNPSITTKVIVNAQCLTAPRAPTISNSVSDFYCNGTANSPFTSAKGRFQTISLSSLAAPTGQVSQVFSAPTVALNGRCELPKVSSLTCRQLESVFNELPFDDSVAVNTKNQSFAYCCSCMYSFTLNINIQQDNVVRSYRQADGSYRIDVDDSIKEDVVAKRDVFGSSTKSASWWARQDASGLPGAHGVGTTNANDSANWLAIAAPLSLLLVVSVTLNALILMRNRST